MTGHIAPPGGGEPDEMANDDAYPAALDPKIQAVLGKALRAMSQDIVAEPVPDKFLALLAKLESREHGGKK